jgi:hypothetical protein
MIKEFLASAGLALCINMASAHADDRGGDREAEIITALEEIAAFSENVLMTDTGEGLADYNMLTSEWLMYETHWHTGQLIWGLLEAGKVLDRPDLIGKAELGGKWWISTEYPDGHPFAGLVSAAHGDKLGELINWTTIADGTPGLFALSRATGNPVYADTAVRSGEWLWENTRVPEDIEGGEWLFYNIFDPDEGIVYTDWDVHTQGLPRDAEEAAEDPAPITRVARPNIEGFLFEDMCRHTGEEIWCERFLAQADALLDRQGEEGLWLDFEPNRKDGSQVHPRFNVWNAEALLQAYEISGDEKYLEGAAKTARWAQSVMRRDGTLYYRTAVEGYRDRGEVTGSAVAFNGILMLRLKHYGYDEFNDTIDTFADWLMANRFSVDHPDPNLAGAVINTRQKIRGGELRIINRDVGSTFAMRFLALYLRDLRGEDVNEYLNP